MNDLLKVNYETETPTVSARDLHEALEIKERFSLWFGRIADAFAEGEDFTSVGKPTVVNNGAERILDDYLLTVEMAKHVSLMCKTEKGKQCRTYFIDLEKAWNTPEQVFARALKMADRQIQELRARNVVLMVKRQEDQPKVIFADAVSASHTSILIGELAKILKQNGVDIGEKRLFAWLRENRYLIRRNGTDYNAPTQRSMEAGLFTVKETAISHSDGHVTVSKTTKVTGEGQKYFINKFLNCQLCI